MRRSGKVYCSNRCQADYQWERYIERWQAGEETGVISIGHISQHIRRYLVLKYGERCSQCGWAARNPVTGKVPITVDHIDGDWNNNREENLRLLCPNCHSLTPTYQGLNRGKGRPWRYKKVRT
ncbi:MAG: HNH endonuclease signature motif containing protein [Chloroflexia bacterium]